MIRQEVNFVSHEAFSGDDFDEVQTRAENLIDKLFDAGKIYDDDWKFMPDGSEITWKRDHNFDPVVALREVKGSAN